MPEPRFPGGQVVATPAALDALEYAEVPVKQLLDRHFSGDWGDISEADKQENELSVEKGFRIWSAYNLPTGVRVSIITEADRSATTVLLSEEY